MPYSCINHSSHSTSNNIVYSANIPSVSCSISSPSAARSTPPSPSSINTCSNQVTDHCELNSRSSYSPEKTKPHREQYKGKSQKNLYFTHSKNYQHPSEISTNWRADSALQSKSQEVTQDSKVAAQSSNFNVIHLAQVQGANSNLSLEIAPIQDPSKMIPFPFFAIPVMNVPQSYEGSGNYQSGDAGTNQANGSNQQPNPQTPGVSPAPPISSMMMQAPSAPSMPLQQPGPPSPSSLPSPGQGYTSGYPSPYFIANAMPQMMNNENMPMNPYMITAPPVFVNNSSPVEGPLYGPGPPIITGDRLKGPRGCNLFVFHLPNEITNW